VLEVLAIAAYSIRTEGWLSAKGGYGSEFKSTKSDVFSLITPPSHDAPARVKAEHAARLAAVSEHDHAVGQKACAWVLEQAANSDYMHNLQAICKSCVTGKSVGIAVSAIVAYQRAMEQEVARKQRAEAPPSNHVGTVGERSTFKLQVLSVRYVDTDWGSKAIVRMQDASGNIFMWFSTSEPELEIGEHYSVKGTVKKHDEYKGTKQTVLSRCKVSAIEVATA
jgi:hypothetical protein